MWEALEFVRDLLNVEKQQEIIRTFGYIVLAVIVFAETGLLVGFFLPGDSLLFSAGVVSALEGSPLNIVTLNLLLIVCAIVGDAVGYTFGRWSGVRLFEKEESFFFRRKHLLATQAFYEKHGGKTIVIARFMPFARTFAPIVAGIAQMPYSRFAVFNVTGGVSWVMSMTLLGYFLGSKLSAKNTERAILLIIAFSVMPLFIGWLRSYLADRKAAKAALAAPAEKPAKADPTP